MGMQTSEEVQDVSKPSEDDREQFSENLQSAYK
jgi:hypothetical protein